MSYLNDIIWKRLNISVGKWILMILFLEKTEAYIFENKEEFMWKTLVALNSMFFSSLKLVMATQLNTLG